MRKAIFLFDAARIFAMAVCVCSVAFLASCDPDPVKPDPDPDPDEPIVVGDITFLPLVLNERHTTDEAGKYILTDEVTVAVKVKVTEGDASKEVDDEKETTLTSEATWSAGTISIDALTGEIAKRATITASEAGVTLDFGAFKVENYVAFKNMSYKYEYEDKSADLPFYGFNNALIATDASVVIKTVDEDNKKYDVTTVTQAFKIKHTDGTEKEIVAVFEYKAEQEDLGDPTGFEELSWDVTDSGTDEYGVWWYNYLYTYRIIYEKGTRDFTYEYKPLIELENRHPTERIFTDFVAPTNFTVSKGVGPGKAFADIPYMYEGLKYFRMSDPANNVSTVCDFDYWVRRLRWMWSSIDLSSYDVELVGAPRTEVQAAYEENIDGTLYTVTPYKVMFTVKWGPDHQGDSSYVVEECKVK